VGARAPERRGGDGGGAGERRGSRSRPALAARRARARLAPGLTARSLPAWAPG
jgi:hypothetical protein